MTDQRDHYMAQALKLRSQSCNTYRQVGAIITNGIGACNSYVGPFEGLQTTQHAEADAICQSAAKGIPTEGHEIFVTLSPCIQCAKLIIQAGINTVYFYELDPEQKLALRLMFNKGVTLIGPVGPGVQDGPGGATPSA